jgi:hypothetical protein
MAFTSTQRSKLDGASATLVASTLLASTIVVLFIGWSFFYTSWFIWWAAVLGCAGVSLLSGQAFVRRLLFDNVFAPVVYGLALIAEVMLFLSCGSIKVENLHDEVNVSVSPVPLGKARTAAAPEPAELLAKHATSTGVRWLGVLGAKSYRVNVSGLPTLDVEVRAPWINSLQAPSSFLIPIVLIVPHEEWVRIAQNMPGELRVAVDLDGKKHSVPFAGNSILVGSGPFQLPQSIQDKLDKMSADAGVAQDLTQPISFKEGQRLAGSGTVQAWMRNKQGDLSSKFSCEYRTPATVDELVQLLELKFD